MSSRFTVRVRLFDTEQNDAEWSTYDSLHAHLLAEDFLRTIRASDDTIYQLPPGEYNYLGSTTPEDVRDRAIRAVRRVWRHRFEVLVTPTSGRVWIGLEVAARDEALDHYLRASEDLLINRL